MVSGSDVRTVQWQGRSGRPYRLISEDLASFAFALDRLYLVAKGTNVLWVGSSDELVGDPASRDRFRLALDCADRVFCLDMPAPGTDRLSTIWDLEGAGPLSGWNAQAA